MPDERTTVVKTGGNNLGLIFLALAIIAGVIVAIVFLQGKQSKDDAVTGAASAVSEAAKDVGDAAKRK